MVARRSATAAGAETGPEGDAGGIDEPMGEKEENLDERDAKDWPGFQIRISFLP